MTTDPSAPSAAVTLPRALRTRPEFIAACAERDFGALFALAKKYGISQVRLAGALDMTASRVGEIIHGKRKVTSVEVVERVSDRFRIPGHMLGLAPRAWERYAPAAQNALGIDDETPGGLDDLAAVVGYENREVTSDLALRMAHTWLVTEPPQITEMAAGRRMGTDLLHRVVTRVDHLRHMDDFIGGGDLHTVVTRELGRHGRSGPPRQLSRAERASPAHRYRRPELAGRKPRQGGRGRGGMRRGDPCARSHRRRELHPHRQAAQSSSPCPTAVPGRAGSRGVRGTVPRRSPHRLTDPHHGDSARTRVGPVYSSARQSEATPDERARGLSRADRPGRR